MNTEQTNNSGQQGRNAHLRRFRVFVKQIRKKHYAFVFFVLLSAVAWFIRALSDTYVASIEYPVKYTNLPPNRILTDPPLDKLRLQVQSDGYTILSSRLKYKRPLSYNVNAFALYSLTVDSTSVYTLTRYATKRLSTELSLSNKDINILDIDPDTLIFNFSRVKKKRVPVQVVLSQSSDFFAKQYMLNGLPTAEPDTIEITGPSFIVDTIQYIATQPVRFSKLDDTATKRIQLRQYARIILPNKKVRVTVPVDEFTEAETEVSIYQKNVPDSVTLKTFPKNATVKYNITLSHYDKIGNDVFKTWVDYATIDPNISSRLLVQLDSTPSIVHNAKVIPRYVEFIIEMKDEENWSNRRDR